MSLICWCGLDAIIRCCTTRSGESTCAAKKSCTRTPLACRRSTLRRSKNCTVATKQTIHGG
jgi:hypothetical protein